LYTFAKMETSDSTLTTQNILSKQKEVQLKTSAKRQPSLLICYLLLGLSIIGICGLHRLYLHHWRTGILYFFTFGLIGLGTLKDIIYMKSLLPTPIQTQKQAPSPILDDLLRLIGTALLALMPIHWVLVILVVACFSLSWALPVGVVLFTYPQVMWERVIKKPIKIWNALKEFPLFHVIFEYFPMVLIKTSTLDSNKQYIFGYHPHGTYSFGLFCSCFPKISGWDKSFPGIKCVIAVANSLLCIPILCTIFGWLGFLPASKSSIEYALNEGYSIVLVPGGIAEMIEGSTIDKEFVFLHERKGFIRLAITKGLELVPIYGFGENDTFIRYKFWKKFRSLLSRKLRITIQLFRGRWFTLVPFNNPINVVVGTPIKVFQNSNPSEEEVDQVLKAYIEGLQKLFEEHKHKVGYEKKQLVVL